MNLLEENLDILRTRFPEIARQVLAAESDPKIRFSLSKNGLKIIYEVFGEREYPLHSTVDPSREAERLLKTSGNAGFIIVYGLGTGWHLHSLMNRKDTILSIIIDSPGRLRSLLGGFDYRMILEHPRINLLLEPDPEILAEYILQSYLPGLHGGFSFVSLPALSSRRRERVTQLQESVDLALERVRDDYSVQAHFGLLWNRNCIANMASLPGFPDHSSYDFLTTLSNNRCILIGAGPSLRDDRKLLQQRAADSTLIAVDTALPILQQLDLVPDLVVSIDSQYYTLLHALQPGSLDIPWAVTLSAPPALIHRLKRPLLFAGGTPLEKALARQAGLPEMDTRGGNVLQAAIALMVSAGIQDLTIFGADYSQPGGIPYAPGTYVDHWFRIRQKRTSPFLGQSLEFTFKSRPDRIDTSYDPLYPCRRLDRYREDMRMFLTTYPGKLDIHGESSRLLLQGQKIPKLRENPSSLKTPGILPLPGELLLEIAQKVRHSGDGTLQILYPLIAALRHRHKSSAETTGNIIEESRKLFLRLVYSYAGE